MESLASKDGTLGPRVPRVPNGSRHDPGEDSSP